VEAQGDRQSEKLEELGPLPGGHHGLSRKQILDSQRERLLAAISAEVVAHGYRATKLVDIVKLASVSTRDFYDSFDSKEDCFLAAFEIVDEYLRRLVSEAAAAEADWPSQVVSGLRAVLEFCAVEPDLARLCLIESVSATPTIALRFREAVLACIPALARGRGELPPGRTLPDSIEDSLLGGLISQTARRLLSEDPQALPDLLPDLVDFVLNPYLGAGRASELAAAALPE
jgi:AcrR family transcriptional regulator